MQQKVGENANPWPAVDAAFAAPVAVLPKGIAPRHERTRSNLEGLSAERKAYLRLLSRFELTSEQAKAFYDDGSRRRAGWGGADREILQDPYRIFELTRHDPEGVRLLTVDRGVFAEDMVRLQHPLEVPSQLESAVDCVERALSQSRLWKRQRTEAIPCYPKTGSSRRYAVTPLDRNVLLLAICSTRWIYRLTWYAWKWPPSLLCSLIDTGQSAIWCASRCLIGSVASAIT
jgi:hypothetical protein